MANFLRYHLIARAAYHIVMQYPHAMSVHPFWNRPYFWLLPYAGSFAYNETYRDFLLHRQKVDRRKESA